ncbi:MAG: efflux RND transporter periplasmic adaptor subunit, partial [Bacteroidota bacterium]
AIFAIYQFFFNAGGPSNQVTTAVQRGVFQVKVFTTGELEAKNSVEIKGPSALRSAGIWRVQISDIVPEGTVVDKGEYIASLDRTEISTKLKDANSELVQFESKFTQTRLDTTLELRQARENLVNLNYQLRENKIALEQSQYEPPATIRQAKIELEKSENAYHEAVDNYALKVQQAEAKMQEVAASLQKARNKIDLMQGILSEFNIMAPEEGMVIYKRDWNGRKRGVGSEISPWDPVVAKLPDLSVMISKTYVNEVDIRKIETGQQVNITLDAFPDKSLTGEVIAVANVGEQLKNSDAKVFEVKVEVMGTDTNLRPAMTTGNSIIASEMEDVLYMPLEAVQNQGDTLVFAFLKSGLTTVKQELELGVTNDNYAVILQGLSEGDQVLMSKPDNAETLPVERLPMEVTQN